MKASKIIWSPVWVAFLIIIFRKLVWDEFNGEVIGSAIFGAFFGVIIFEYFAFKQFGKAGKYLANSVPQVQLRVNENLILQGAANYLKGNLPGTGPHSV